VSIRPADKHRVARRDPHVAPDAVGERRQQEEAHSDVPAAAAAHAPVHREPDRLGIIRDATGELGMRAQARPESSPRIREADLNPLRARVGRGDPESGLRCAGVLHDVRRQLLEHKLSGPDRARGHRRHEPLEQSARQVSLVPGDVEIRDPPQGDDGVAWRVEGSSLGLHPELPEEVDAPERVKRISVVFLREQPRPQTDRPSPRDAGGQEDDPGRFDARPGAEHETQLRRFTSPGPGLDPGSDLVRREGRRDGNRGQGPEHSAR
jgi:hypothetical protein